MSTGGGSMMRPIVLGSARAARYLQIKYGIDRVLAVLVLPIAAPLMGVIAIGIKLDDGGPVFFRQERAGRDGVPFRIWKFRTMVPEAWEIGHGYIPEGMTLVTRVGSFLRATSFDEVPQILNILKGEMSFVGPRPTLLDQVARYTPEQRGRLLVKPGILGWAQLHGRNELPWSKRIEYDLEYVRRVSLAFDLKIVARTIPMVLRGSGIKLYQTPDEVDDLGGDR
jgi:lipopolysaccharide/colanic/teichoic acid biosynthesis glycosyltransferase